MNCAFRALFSAGVLSALLCLSTAHAGFGLSVATYERVKERGSTVFVGEFEVKT